MRQSVTPPYALPSFCMLYLSAAFSSWQATEPPSSQHSITSKYKDRHSDYCMPTQCEDTPGHPAHSLELLCKVTLTGKQKKQKLWRMDRKTCHCLLHETFTGMFPSGKQARHRQDHRSKYGVQSDSGGGASSEWSVRGSPPQSGAAASNI